ncbi:MAG: dihydropteroate synthase [SAR202 cluster bacterium]|nr:dihydropteroate synthase [SAR202 cluster bacterium]
MSKGETVIGNCRFVWGSRTYVIGIVNTTPDSFSGDGIGADVEAAVSQALQFEACGVDIVDIGGESTRPPSYYSGAEPVSADEESSRVIPVLTALASALRVPIRVETSKADVARHGVAAGASMINDVWGLRRDPEMAAVAVEMGVPVVLMHNQDGTEYDDLVPDVIGGLRGLMESALDAGVPEGNIVLDPGIGFGKTAEQSLEVLRRLKEFESLGRPILTGTSRKSSIGKVLDLPVDDRIEGTAATVALSIAGGADIIRVHDVREMVRVARMSDAIVRGWSEQ